MNRVKEIRERRQIALETLAERVGVSARLLRALEDDATVATVDVAVRLTSALRVPIDELFFVDDANGRRIVLSREISERRDAETAPKIVENGENGKTEQNNEAAKNAPTEAIPQNGETAQDNLTTKTAQKKKNRKNAAPEQAAESVASPSRPTPTLFDAVAEPANSVDLPQIAAPPVAPSRRASAKKVAAPTKSETRSSADSKTADEDGLAPPPAELRDPNPTAPIRFFDLFCGIGGFRYAAERTFAKMRRDAVCALSCDFDVPAQRSYSANFGETPVGDVAELPSDEIPDFDVLFAGFPCQAFSIIGLRKGFADETKGSLFFQIARILRDKRPRAFVLENVRQLTTHDDGRTFATILRILQEELGYCVDWRIMNALDCGLPQKRERVAIVGALEPFEIAWPKRKTDGKTLADVLENDADVDRKYFASPEIVRRRKEAHQSDYFPAIWHENKSGNVSSYPYSCALRAGASYNYLLVNGERRLTPRELLRLQGFPDSFKIVVSDSQLRKQAGNAAPVDLVERVLDRFLPLVFACGPDAETTN